MMLSRLWEPRQSHHEDQQAQFIEWCRAANREGRQALMSQEQDKKRQ